MSGFKTVLLKECRDNFRDRRTILSSFSLAVLGPVLFIGLMSFVLNTALGESSEPAEVRGLSGLCYARPSRAAAMLFASAPLTSRFSISCPAAVGFAGRGLVSGEERALCTGRAANDTGSRTGSASAGRGCSGAACSEAMER